MRKMKAKRGFWQDRMLPFVIVWALSIGTVGVVSRLWQVAPLPFLYNEPEVRVTLSLLMSMIGTGLVQVFLVERLLKKPMRGWMLYTVTSAVIAAFLNQVTPSLFLTYILPRIPNFDLFDLVISLALNAPASLLQAFWLHKHVKRAWLWPLATIPLLLAFTNISFGGEQYQLLKIITLLSVGIVQASLMHYFWQDPKETGKAKIAFATDGDSHLDHERSTRLQERDRSSSQWDISDDQALQSEA